MRPFFLLFWRTIKELEVIIMFIIFINCMLHVKLTPSIIFMVKYKLSMVSYFDRCNFLIIKTFSDVTTIILTGGIIKIVLTAIKLEKQF